MGIHFSPPRPQRQLLVPPRTLPLRHRAPHEAAPHVMRVQSGFGGCGYASLKGLLVLPDPKSTRNGCGVGQADLARCTFACLCPRSGPTRRDTTRTASDF